MPLFVCLFERRTGPLPTTEPPGSPPSGIPFAPTPWAFIPFASALRGKEYPLQRKPVYELPDTTESGLNLLEYTENLLELYNPDSHHCERCGKKIWSSGKVSSYSRGFIWPCNGKPGTDTIQIPIHLCEKCGKSADGSGNRDGNYMHAILPQVLIPFSAYTLPFVFTVLREYACPKRSCTVVQLCEHWQIAVSTLYSWIRRYKDQYDAWADSLDSIREQEGATAKAKINPCSVIRKAIAAALNRIFSEVRDLPGKFFRKFAFSFMQPKALLINNFRNYTCGRMV